MSRRPDPLEGVPIFARMSKSQRRMVERLMSPLSRESGRVLMREGEVGREFIVILEGEVEIVRDGEVLARRGKGEFLGEISLLLERPRTASVRAVGPVEVEVIECHDFWELLRSHPELYEPLVKAIAHRLAESDL